MADNFPAQIARREKGVPKASSDATFLWNLFQSASMDKERFFGSDFAEGDRWFKFYKGDQWPSGMPVWKAQPVFNKVFSTIETIVPLITDRSAFPQILPRTEQDALLAGPIQNLYDMILQSNMMKSVNQEVARGAEIYGTYFYKVTWNPDLAGGLGDIEIGNVSPRNIFPAPGFKDIDDPDIPYVVVASVIDDSTLKREFGDDFDIDKIPGGIQVDGLQNLFGVAKSGTESRSAGRRKVRKSAAGSALNHYLVDADDVESFGGDIDIPTKAYTHLEIWMKSDVRDDEGNVKFPQGRVIDWVNGHIVRDRENPFGFIPYVKYVGLDIPEIFWGMGTTELVIEGNRTVNKLYGQIIDSTALAVNPPVKKDFNALDASLQGKWFAYPGAIHTITPGSTFEWMPVPGPHPSLFSTLPMAENILDTETGIFDVTQGRRPRNVESAQGIALIQQSSQTRIRPKIRNLENSLYKVYIRIAKLIKRFYTAERVIRVRDENDGVVHQDVNKLLAISDRFQPGIPKEVDSVAQPVGEADEEFGFGEMQPFSTEQGDMILPVPDNDIVRWLKNPVFMADFDIHIIPGSSLPVEQRIRAQEAFRLFEIGVLDDAALLDELEWPKRDAILQRTAKIKKLIEENQQLQQTLQELVAEVQKDQEEEAVEEAESGGAPEEGGGPPQGFTNSPGGQDMTTLEAPVPEEEAFIGV